MAEGTLVFCGACEHWLPASQAEEARKRMNRWVTIDKQREEDRKAAEALRLKYGTAQQKELFDE